MKRYIILVTILFTAGMLVIPDVYAVVDNEWEVFGTLIAQQRQAPPQRGTNTRTTPPTRGNTNAVSAHGNTTSATRGNVTTTVNTRGNTTATPPTRGTNKNVAPAHAQTQQRPTTTTTTVTTKKRNQVVPKDNTKTDPKKQANTKGNNKNLSKKELAKRQAAQKAHAQQVAANQKNGTAAHSGTPGKPTTSKGKGKGDVKGKSNVQQQQAVGAHPYKLSNKVSTTFSHASIAIDGGVALPFTDYEVNKMPINYYGGFTFLWHFNPVWALGARYSFHYLDVNPKNYNRVNKGLDDLITSPWDVDENGDRVLRDGYEVDDAGKEWVLNDDGTKSRFVPEVSKKQLQHPIHDVTAVFSFNLRNAWFSSKPKDIFNFYLLFGIGASIFEKSGIYYYYERYNQGLEPSMANMSERREYAKPLGLSLLLAPGFLFDFNICQTLSLGLRATANIYPQDAIEYWKSGTQKDFFFDGGLSLTYKINTKKKTHMQNITNADKLLMKNELRAMLEAEEKNRKPDITADSIRKIVNAIKRIHDTTVVVHIDTIYMAGGGGGEKYTTEHHQADTTPLLEVYKANIFFVPNSAALTDYSNNILKEVVQKMDEDQSIIAEIMGYNDLTGTEAANKKVALKRANTVANQLVNTYKIPRSRIKYIGQGKYGNSKAVQNTSVSRRAQVILYKP